MVYVIQLASRIRTELQFRTNPARKLSASLYVLLCVQWKTADDGQMNYPKHVEFYSENKFEHLVGFIIRIYHDARSPEREIYTYCLQWIAQNSTVNSLQMTLYMTVPFWWWQPPAGHNEITACVMWTTDSSVVMLGQDPIEIVNQQGRIVKDCPVVTGRGGVGEVIQYKMNILISL